MERVYVATTCRHYTLGIQRDLCLPCYDKIHNDPDPHVNGTYDCYCCCRCHNTDLYPED